MIVFVVAIYISRSVMFIPGFDIKKTIKSR